jgi:hypothetical protein
MIFSSENALKFQLNLTVYVWVSRPNVFTKIIIIIIIIIIILEKFYVIT